MAVTVETLEKLERKITLSVPVTLIQAEVDSRLKRLARTVKMDGFRPGKVPLNVVAQRYGYSVQYEVVNDKVGEAFAKAANEAKLRVAGQPSHHGKGRRPRRPSHLSTPSLKCSLKSRSRICRACRSGKAVGRSDRCCHRQNH
jgi:hypothetical protein